MSLSERVSGLMTPHAANWYGGTEPWSTIYGLPLRLAESARRFDTSPAWFGALGAGLTLPWLARLDGAVVEAHCVGLANRLCDELELPVSVVADAADKLRAAGLRASVRAGAVRVGFHVYNTDEDLQRLLDVLRC
jgi:selenocysteine lyase/cysteine desulfurase